MPNSQDSSGIALISPIAEPTPTPLPSMPVLELFATAEKLKASGDTKAAVNIYKAWIAHNSADPILFAVYFNYGVALANNSDPFAAINALREAIRLKSDFFPPYINLGRLLEDNGQLLAAVEVWRDAVNRLGLVNGENVSHRNTALQQIGRVLEGASDSSGAEEALRLSLDLDPRQGEPAQHWISLRQGQCKWPVIQPWDRANRTRIISGIAPLSLANLADDPLYQLARAFNYNRKFIGVPDMARRKPDRKVVEPSEGRRIRLGYVSSDFREHAVGFAMTDVMETHDRSAFEIFAYYCGISRVDPTRERIKANVDHWTDINGLSDDEAAQKIEDDRIDILVDLNGYTKSARTKVFSLRPAPIAVNWFGFPSTMGSPYHHYIIADDYIIPEGFELYYTEKVLRLPCYQPNDRRRLVSPTRPSRADEGLPNDAVVFCCLNGMQKLTPLVFARWMTILGQVPNSVLWLLTGSDDTNARLRQKAAEAGIAPERFVFAQKKPNPDHLARYPLADLFLDTLPYGAHTTAADSLWMSVPILTLPGRSFASRVCGSLLQAAGLPDLICTDPADYVTKAIALGQNPDALAEMKQRLAANRDRCLLFDTPRLIREIEALYRQMMDDLEQGRRPVPNLRNLELYHNIGRTLDIETLELLDTDAYLGLYRAKLAEAHDFSPVASDDRLWQAPA